MALTEKQKLIRSRLFPGHRGRLAPPQQEKFVAECIKNGCPLGGDGGIESRVKRTDTVEKTRGTRTPKPKKSAAVGGEDQEPEDEEDADKGVEQHQPQRKRRGRPSKQRDTPASDKRARRPSALAIAAAETAAAEAEEEEETEEESAEEEDEVVVEEQEEERGAPNAKIGQLGSLRSASRRGRGRGRGRGRSRGAGTAGGQGRIMVTRPRLASLGELAAAGDGNTPADDAGSGHVAGSLGPVEYYAAYKSYYEALECYCKLTGEAVGDVPRLQPPHLLFAGTMPSMGELVVPPAAAAAAAGGGGRPGSAAKAAAAAAQSAKHDLLGQHQWAEDDADE